MPTLIPKVPWGTGWRIISHVQAQCAAVPWFTSNACQGQRAEGGRALAQDSHLCFRAISDLVPFLKLMTTSPLLSPRAEVCASHPGPLVLLTV